MLKFLVLFSIFSTLYQIREHYLYRKKKQKRENLNKILNGYFSEIEDSSVRLSFLYWRNSIDLSDFTEYNIKLTLNKKFGNNIPSLKKDIRSLKIREILKN
jgi:hypothetical protein